MPTPLTPDEAFDAQFRLGFEHYPEQPEDPAAWHRMELLLDADLRQQALRRRVWRLLGAEAMLLLIGVWAAFFLLLEKLPIRAGQPVAAAQEASRLTGHGYSAAGKLAPADQAAPRMQATRSAAAGALGRLAATSHTRKVRGAETEKPLAARHNVPLRAAATAPLRQPSSAAEPSQQVASEASPTVTNRPATSSTRAPRSGARFAAAATRHVAPKNRFSTTLVPLRGTPQLGLASTSHKLTLHQGKRWLQQPVSAIAKGLTKEPMAVAGRGNTRQAATASATAATKATQLLGFNNRHAPASPAEAGGRAATLARTTPIALPIDLLAPRWPASGLRCQLPDSLALLALPPTHPTDSLNQPAPRPLLSAYRFRLGLVGAPELSTVRADRLSKPGSSLGVVLEYQLGRRWRVSAGYLYTNKIYVARGTDYTLPAGYTMPHGYVISNVSATCRIVDIPLNLRYDLWQRPRYQVFASAGLSSLLMRREQYTYDYELVYGKPVAPYSWELDNGSQHVLKILNLSAGYERAVGQRWTVQAEPFVKLPLAGVGFGAVRLSSAGVFFSLKYGLLPVHPAPALR